MLTFATENQKHNENKITLFSALLLSISTLLLKNTASAQSYLWAKSAVGTSFDRSSSVTTDAVGNNFCFYISYRVGGVVNSYCFAKSYGAITNAIIKIYLNA
ncbi:MAG: hypothetical protein IPJ79_16680 [Bacteroidetes bacterium]|nr:hypothetical protein [Bacteroidota bacterium]